MAADADIFPTEHFTRLPLVGSLALHAVLFALALFGYLLPSGRGENWGGTEGGGGAMSATLVSSIPLPRRSQRRKTYWPTSRKASRSRRRKKLPRRSRRLSRFPRKTPN